LKVKRNDATPTALDPKSSMHLYCRIKKGFGPSLFKRVWGASKDETVLRAQFCLTEKGSSTILPSKNVAQVFSSILYKLAGGRPLIVLFPDDLGEIKKKLKGLNISQKEKKGGLWIEVTSPDASSISQILEVTGFTTFYVQVKHETQVLERAINGKVEDLFNRLEESYFVGVLTIYDESMEVISKFLPACIITNIVREVGTEAG